MIGDCGTAALVSRTGSIDWLCWPRFDSGACFAALVGTPDNGRWLIAPRDPSPRIRRFYRDGSVVLETVFATDDGEVGLIDFMPVGRPNSAVVRLVRGRRGRVAMRMDLALRFDYGGQVPWVTRLADGSGVSAIAGPDMAILRTSVPLDGVGLHTVAEFSVAEGETVSFVLTHCASHLPPPPPLDPLAVLAETEAYWTRWSGRAKFDGRYNSAVKRSLITLKALTYAPTGGIVAAPTTSLPEQLGGGRNWDYRFCWLRDATITLLSFMRAGYFDEAQAWRDWLHRSIAGSPDQLQIMYGIGGERRLAEWEANWLSGYQGARPVRVGNAAHEQVQLDVYGEMMDALHQARIGGLASSPDDWDMQRSIVSHLETIWDQPDEGVWEVRGGRRPFVFSKVMAWVALDRSIRSAEAFGLEAPLERWRALRDTIHATVCREGYSTAKGSFTQSFGSSALDASLLLIPMVGFLPPGDPRVIGTLAAVERELLVDGYVLRYRTEGGGDGLPPGEGAFLACSFWLADSYAQQGRRDEAIALFERLLSLRNDLGLLAEEYDPKARRQVGNFPQAFSHVALVASAYALARDDGAGTRKV
jgi:GH15 family glucan-1,4-alpha-glucosidase